MKKLIKLSLVLAVIIGIMGISSVYAAGVFNAELKADKGEYTVGEEATVTVTLTNMQVGNGINVFGAALQYDKNCFENVKVEGINGWGGVVFNEENGALALDSANLMKDAGAIINIKFKVKKAGTMTITKIDASGGEGDIYAEDASTTIKIAGSENPSSRPDDNTASRPADNPNSTPIDNIASKPTDNPSSIPNANGGNGNQGGSTNIDQLTPTNQAKPGSTEKVDGTNTVKLPPVPRR